MNKRNIKYSFSIAGMFLIVNSLKAQDSTADPYFMERLFTSILVVCAAIVVVTAIAVLYRLITAMIKIQQLRVYKEQGLEAYLKKEKKPAKTTNWWKAFRKRWIGGVPVEKEEDILFKHSFDGIYELDNKLPPWWLAMFYITIIWSVGYLVYYHFTDAGLSSIEEYELAVAKAEEEIAAHRAKSADSVNENNVTLITDESALMAGKATYETLCAACHGMVGEGGIGPGFTDNFWIHGCSVKDVFKVIKYGVPEKGMIAWSSQLKPSEMAKVASYILTMPGNEVPNPKEPQGEECINEDSGPPTDGGGDELGMK